MSIDNKLCCIVIPIYKINLNEYEIISLKQCCKILKNYTIVFITHNKLDCGSYDKICKKYNISYKYEYFNQVYFSSLYGYNALMLSKMFYRRFTNYKYILIYQLDAYIFKDELEYWCGMEYDYIGAPWTELNGLKTTPKFRDAPSVGNGGFSLRNNKIFIKYYNIHIGIKWFTHLFASYYKMLSNKSKKNKIYFIPRIPLYFIFQIIRWLFLKKSEDDNNEDAIWSILLYKKGHLPDAAQAIKFSFENFPEYFYKLNNNILPFGCHSWHRYYNYMFWEKYIIKVNL